LRNGYMQMQWSRVQMFLLFNTAELISIIMAREKGKNA